MSAALLTNDPRPVAETSAWICEVLRTRGVDPSPARELRELLADTLVAYPQARELIAKHFTDALR